MTDYEYIREKIPADELLCQLMEECGELAAAANHLRRARNGLNPTPLQFDEAAANFSEEVADVLTTLNAIGGYTSAIQIDENVILRMRFKAERWKERIKRWYSCDDAEAE